MNRPFRTLSRAVALLCLLLAACSGSGTDTGPAIDTGSTDTGSVDTGPVDTGSVDTGLAPWFGSVTLAHCAAGGAMTRGPVRAVVCLAPADAGAARVQDEGWTFDAGPTRLLQPTDTP